jgi:30S ribosomal protein S31
MLGYAPSETTLESAHMGKGDRKTAKGKRNISSYGNARSAKAATKGAVTKAAVAAPKPAVKKAPAKKAAAK